MDFSQVCTHFKLAEDPGSLITQAQSNLVNYVWISVYSPFNEPANLWYAHV